MQFVRRLSSRRKSIRVVHQGVMRRPRLAFRRARRFRRFNNVVHQKRYYRRMRKIERLKGRRLSLLSLLVGRDRDRIKRKLLRLKFSRNFHKLTRRAPTPSRRTNLVVGSYWRKSRMLVRKYKRRFRQSGKFVLRKFAYSASQKQQQFLSKPYFKALPISTSTKDQLHFVYDRSPQFDTSCQPLSSQYLPLNLSASVPQHSPTFTHVWYELHKLFDNFYLSEPTAIEPGFKNWLNCNSIVRLPERTQVSNSLSSPNRGHYTGAPCLPNSSQPSASTALTMLFVSTDFQISPLSEDYSMWRESQAALRALKGLDTAVEVGKLSIALNRLNLGRKARNLALSYLSAEFVPHEF